MKHILFPMDFSDRCCAAVPYVEAMANRYGARVTLISVQGMMYYAAMGDLGGPIMASEETMLEELKQQLASALTHEFAHLRVDRIAEIGDAAQVITAFAHTHGVDLIMMPTHGFGPFRRLLIGSVTAKVLHDAECPVWTAAHVERGPAADHLPCRNVLCAIDGTPKSVALMRWARDFAQETGASLRLAHVVPEVDQENLHGFDPAYDHELRKRAGQTVRELKEAANVDAPYCVTGGSIAAGISKVATCHGADLVVIGRGTLQGTLGRLRTHAYGIIRQSPCPVLSV